MGETADSEAPDVLSSRLDGFRSKRRASGASSSLTDACAPQGVYVAGTSESSDDLDAARDHRVPVVPVVPVVPRDPDDAGGSISPHRSGPSGFAVASPATDAADAPMHAGLSTPAAKPPAVTAPAAIDSPAAALGGSDASVPTATPPSVAGPAVVPASATVSPATPATPPAADAPDNGTPSAAGTRRCTGSVSTVPIAPGSGAPIVPWTAPSPVLEAPVTLFHRFLHALRWLLAVAGVFLLFFVGMGVGAVVVYRIISVLEAAVSEAPSPLLPRGWTAPAETADLLASIGGQLGALMIVGPLWLAVRRHAFGFQRRVRRGPRQIARIAVATAFTGIWLQLAIGYVLGLVLSFLPDLAREYDQIMRETGGGSFSPLSVITVAVLAPLVEETACRGLMLELFLRAFTPRWRRGRTAAEGLVPSSRAVAFAIVCQAAVFAVMHGNLVQGCYALAMGVVFGWAYWRSGSLVCSMGLHLAINFSSFLVPIAGVALDPLGYTVTIPLTAAAGIACLAAFARAVDHGGA